MTTAPILDTSTVLGVVPARGGSKSIPLKNLAEVGGRQLVAYMAAAARASRLVGEVVCSTDHAGIADAATRLGLRVDRRAPELAQDDTPITAVLVDLLHRLAAERGAVPWAVALLQPTSPFLRGRDIDACIEALRADPHAVSAQTVTPVLHNAHAFNQRVVEDGRVRFRFHEERAAAYNKQRKPKHYVFGNLVVTRAQALLEGSDCFGTTSAAVEIPRAYALDVDTPEDLDYADFLVRTGRLVLDPVVAEDGRAHR